MVPFTLKREYGRIDSGLSGYLTEDARVVGEMITRNAVKFPEKTASSEEEIIKFCGEHLAGYKKPKSVEFWQELPKSPQGKILKRAIRERYETH